MPYEEALRLAAATESLREVRGGGMPSASLSFPLPFTGELTAESRANLPTDVAERVWKGGRRMNEAVALARKQAQP